jgi:benzodiazapine receptor
MAATTAHRSPLVHGHAWFALVGFLVLTFAAAGLGSLLTGDPASGWYASLQKPSFNPPNWIFAPVWSALYGAMAVAAWLVYRRAGMVRAHAWFFAQLVLNVLWSGLFFALQRPLAAFVDIVALWALVLTTAIMFARHSRVAAWLFAPYLAWVSFAALLNFSIWRLNS